MASSFNDTGHAVLGCLCIKLMFRWTSAKYPNAKVPSMTELTQLLTTFIRSVTTKGTAAVTSAALADAYPRAKTKGNDRVHIYHLVLDGIHRGDELTLLTSLKVSPCDVWLACLAIHNMRDAAELLHPHAQYTAPHPGIKYSEYRDWR